MKAALLVNLSLSLATFSGPDHLTASRHCASALAYGVVVTKGGAGEPIHNYVRYPPVPLTALVAAPIAHGIQRSLHTYCSCRKRRHPTFQQCFYPVPPLLQGAYAWHLYRTHGGVCAVRDTI